MLATNCCLQSIWSGHIGTSRSVFCVMLCNVHFPFCVKSTSVTVDKLPMGDDNASSMPTAPPMDSVQGYGNVTFSDSKMSFPLQSFFFMMLFL